MGLFSCSIPPLFVLSHSLPMVNTMGKLALFGRFSITASSLPSRLTDYYSLATRFTSHVPRPTIVGVRPRGPRWVQHSPPGRRQYATKCHFSGFRQKFGALGFRRNSIWKLDLRPFLSRLSSDATLDLIAYLERSCAVMSHVADSPQNRHFEPISGRFTPIRPQIIAASGMGYPILGTRETWVVPTVPLATVLPSHAPRSTPDQRGEVVHRTSPPWLLPATDRPIAKNRTGPISTSGSSISVCHRTRRFCGQNNQSRPEAVVLGRPPRGGRLREVAPVGGVWGVELERSRFLPGTDRGFPVDDEFQAHPMSCESLAKP